MDKDILLTLTGGLIGFVSSLSVMAFQRLLDKRGKLNIFYRFKHQKYKDESWGFEKGDSNSIILTIPVAYEFQNTSNVTRVIRDVNLLLYNDNYLVAKMHQADHLHITEREGNTIKKESDFYFGTDKGSYSFVIPPRSIIRQECDYTYSINVNDMKEKSFNIIKLRYYDERNKAKAYIIREMENSWQLKTFEVDEDWKLVK